MSDIKPFSMEYVLRTTAKHMRKSIKISTEKTYGRIAEFADDREKSEEILRTLSALDGMRKEIDEFQSAITPKTGDTGNTGETNV